MLNIRCIPRNERGVVLVVGLILLVALTLLGATAALITTTDMKVGVNYRRSTEAFYLAEAGAEQGRQQLRALNAASANKGVFTDELATVLGPNGIIEGYGNGNTDDVPLVPKTTLGNGSYVVYLTNDVVDYFSNPTDTNRRATLTSVATIPNGTKEASQAIIEITVAMDQPFPLPAAITLLGKGATFTGGQSNAKVLHGDDQVGVGGCPPGGADAPKPVVDVSDPADVNALQSTIQGSKPGTYHTKNAITQQDETAVTAPNDISGSIPPSTLTNITNNFGINLLDPVALNDLVTSIKAQADTVCSNCSGVDVGTTASPKVVVATGDMTLGGSGAGILVVTGTLTLNGGPSYSGLILVIGDGVMQRSGGGGGTISGGIVVANTRGPDNIRGTADDNIALGPPTLNTSGGGASTISYCSSALNNIYSRMPLRIIVWRPHYK